jgi:hypothetical protein
MLLMPALVHHVQRVQVCQMVSISEKYENYGLRPVSVTPETLSDSIVFVKKFNKLRPMQ